MGLKIHSWQARRKHRHDEYADYGPPNSTDASGKRGTTDNCRGNSIKLKTLPLRRENSRIDCCVGNATNSCSYPRNDINPHLPLLHIYARKSGCFYVATYCIGIATKFCV